MQSNSETPHRDSKAPPDSVRTSRHTPRPAHCPLRHATPVPTAGLAHLLHPGSPRPGTRLALFFPSFKAQRQCHLPQASCEGLQKLVPCPGALHPCCLCYLIHVTWQR